MMSPERSTQCKALPVCRLPAVSSMPFELLSRVFLMLSHDDEECSVWHWSCVANVSRLWRQTALMNPLLWSHLTFNRGGLRWIEECLKRAQGVPLTLIQPPHSHQSSVRTAAFRRCLTSLQATHIRVARAHQLVLSLDHFFAEPAPLLESLHVASSDSVLWDYTMTLPSGLFALSAPRLRHLSLRGYKFQWTTFASFPALTHLILRNVTPDVNVSHTLVRPNDAAHATETTWADMLAALGSLANLQELSIEYCWPPHASQPDLGVVELAGLKRLTLSGSSEECSHALEHIRIPTCVQVDIFCLSSPRTAVHDVDRIIPSLPALRVKPEPSLTWTDEEGLLLAAETDKLTTWKLTLSWPASRGRVTAATAIIQELFSHARMALSKRLSVPVQSLVERYRW